MDNIDKRKMVISYLGLPERLKINLAKKLGIYSEFLSTFSTDAKDREIFKRIKNKDLFSKLQAELKALRS